MQRWPEAASWITGLRCLAPGVLAPEAASILPAVRWLGPCWLGEGRDTELPPVMIGPQVLWDHGGESRSSEKVPRDWVASARMLSLAPSGVRTSPHLRARLKRVFDVLFALNILTLTLPLYPLLMLAIWLEDGGPFFFAHSREGLQGKVFPCVKFRSMRKDAEQLKRVLASQNAADGPQFFLRVDPRLTRVGRIMRAANLDELPQFLNVLLGHMAVVGPRPSPYEENQCCPAWREARLSTRPGVTGLWQVSRSREPGLDFQEWIRFDLQYIRHASWWMDASILLRTMGLVLRPLRRVSRRLAAWVRV